MAPCLFLLLITYIMFSCAHCRFKHPDRVMFVKHTRNHEGMDGFCITCPSCGRCFSLIRRFNDHVKTCSAVLSHTPPGSNLALRSLGDDDSTDSAIRNEDAQHLITEPPFDASSSVGGFLGKLRYELNIPATACEIIADGMHDIISRIDDGTGDAVVMKKRHREILKACKNYRSSHKLAGHVHRNSGVIHPLVVTLSRANKPKHTLQYVSIKKQLKRLLVLGLLINAFTPRADSVEQNMTYQDVWDGWHHTVTGGEKVVSLLLYYDEFTVTNPLGTHARSGKLGAVYFTVCNFSKVSRSKVRNIHLALIFRASHVKKYGWAKILEPLISDLNEMEENGLGNGVSVRVGAVVADNLAAHAMAGLSESFSSSACRFCLMSRSDMKSSTILGGNIDAAELYVQERNKFERNEASVFKHLSPLTRVRSYNVAHCHPPDISHDLFEGVGPLTISLALTVICVQKKAVSLETINRIIKSFEYSRLDKTNKPRILSIKNSRIVVRQSMSECWTLLRLLPLMIGHLVPNCSEWSLLILFVRIVEVIVSPSVNEAELVLLQSHIEMFLRGVVSIFGKDITPKMHFMLHYADEVRKHGPLRMLWTLRFEQKHQTMKRLLESSRCRINVCASIARKHEYAMARNRSKPGYLRDSDECLVLSERAGAVKKVRCAGQVYAVGDVLFVSRMASVRCGIIARFLNKRSCVIELFDRDSYDAMRNVYKMKSNGEQIVSVVDRLALYHPAAMYGSYMVLTHAVPGYSQLDYSIESW